MCMNIMKLKEILNEECGGSTGAAGVAGVPGALFSNPVSRIKTQKKKKRKKKVSV